jgi:outer membrane protein
MKNALLALNGILTVCVIILFVKISGNSSSDTGDKKVSIPDGGMKIGFVMTDSLMANYLFFKDREEVFKSKAEEYEKKLYNDQRSFESEAREFEQRAQYLTLTEKESRQQKLIKKQQELMRLQENLSNQLAREESELTREVFDTVQVFLKSFAQKNGLQFVLSNVKGGGIWFADERLDVTKQVIDGLNERYEKLKAGK